MSEAVEMIISADDQASKKFAEVAANAERDLGKIKDAGAKIKGGAAVGGALVKMLGGTELGGAIAQFSELSEKVNQFGEVAKMGTAGSLAFKAGLVGLVGVAAFQVGNAIGNLIFNTKQFEQQMEKARIKIQELAQESLKFSQRSFQIEVADLELIRDPRQKEQEVERLLKKAANEVEFVKSRVRESQNAVDSWAKAWKVTGDRKGFEQQAQQQLEEDKKVLDQKKEELATLQQIKDERERSAKIKEAERIEGLTADFNATLEGLARESILLTEGESAAERWSLKRKGMTSEMISWIVGIREQNNELKKANAEKEKAAQQAAKVADAYSNAATSIQKQRIALEEGEEAARKFELVQQGMSDAMAERIAEEERMLKLDAQRKQVANSFNEQRIAIEQGTEAARAYRLEQEGFTAAEAKQQAAEEKKLRGTEVAKQALEDLRMRRLELEKGAEAARKEQLMLQGVDEATAARIANEEKLLQAREDAKQASAEPAGPVAARESRMLSGRGIAMENVSKQQLQTLIDIHQAIRDQEKKSKVRLVQVQK